MMIQAVIGNPYHPEYGVATIPFPIPHDQYAHCMELLEALDRRGILGGLPLGDDRVLWCATEKVSKEQLDKAVSVVKEVLAK